MSTDRLKQLAIALAVLVFLWGAVEILRDGFDTGEEVFALGQVTPASVDSVVIERSADTVRLVKRADDWAVNGYRADSASVAQLFEQLSDTITAELAGENPATHGRFEVDDATGRKLRMYGNGEVLLDLVVGKRGKDFQSVYVRRPGEDDVYLLSTRVATYVDRGFDDWRNKVIAAVEPDSVSRIDILRGGREYAITRTSDTTWTVDGREADRDEVTRILDQFRKLNATGFPDAAQQDSVRFDPADRRAVLRDAADHVLLDIALDSMVGGFWARRTGDSVVYRLDTFRVNQMTPADSTVRISDATS
jgi:Domain of unknown function (DUF4340)